MNKERGNAFLYKLEKLKKRLKEKIHFPWNKIDAPKLQMVNKS